MGRGPPSRGYPSGLQRVPGKHSTGAHGALSIKVERKIDAV